MAQYPVKDIKANPFRHINRYPIRREKIAALRESLRTTGFWGNIVARQRDGHAEIAYGHHRLRALQEEYGPSHKVDLVIRNLNDEAMLQIMARENMEEWGTSASVEHETIRAVIEAYAQGKVQLPPPDPKATQSQLRYAPSFVAGGDGRGPARAHPYTARTLAKFLGWMEPAGEPQEKVHTVLAALQFIEEGILKESDFEGLTTSQAGAVVEEARKAKTRREQVARMHRLQAEQAEREAKLAEERRKKAEEERRRREMEVASARDTEERRKAAEAAKRFAEERREAEEARRRALARQKVEREKERASVEEGRKRATEVGRAVSSGLKAGKIGYKQAPDLALKVDKRAPEPPRLLEDSGRRIASQLSVILDPERDPRAKRLAEFVKWAEHLTDYTSAELAGVLEVVSGRALDYAKHFYRAPTPSGRREKLISGRRLPSGGQ